MAVIITFLALHWYLSLAAQTLFLHRYASHVYYKLAPRQERLGYILTWLLQGPSYLSPWAYGVLHKAHHSYSDTSEDPHSPAHSKGIFDMMVKTAKIYYQINLEVHPLSRRFMPGVRRWRAFDEFAESWPSRIGWGALYTLIYAIYAPHWAFYLLLPVHFLIGPIQGAIVNWFGHHRGYRNSNTPDQSRNTLPLDLFLMGELYQNNHHAYPNDPNFAKKAWEFDVGHFLLRLLSLKSRVFSLKPIEAESQS